MRYKEARIKKTHEMRGQTKAQVENRSRETAATCHKYVPMPAQLRRAYHKYVPTPVIGLIKDSLINNPLVVIFSDY